LLAEVFPAYGLGDGGDVFDGFVLWLVRASSTKCSECQGNEKGKGGIYENKMCETYITLLQKTSIQNQRSCLDNLPNTHIIQSQVPRTATDAGRDVRIGILIP